MKFPYTYAADHKPDFLKVFPSQKKIYVPLLTVAIRKGAKAMKVRCLLDSGADMCLFPYDLAQVLDIDIETGKPVEVVGIGNIKQIFYFHEIEILFDKYCLKTKAGFARKSIGMSGILGHHGFFEYFTIKFDFKNKEMDITHNDDQIHEILSKARI